MKKILNGKLYDTDKAQSLGSAGYSYPSDFHHWTETLYRKRTGEFFLHGEGGPLSHYAVSIGQNEWTGGEKIIPMSVDSARKWAEENLDADEYEAIFGIPDEDAEPITLCVQLPAQLVSVVRTNAAKDQTSVTAYIEKVLTDALIH